MRSDESLFFRCQDKMKIIVAISEIPRLWQATVEVLEPGSRVLSRHRTTKSGSLMLSVKFLNIRTLEKLL